MGKTRGGGVWSPAHAAASLTRPASQRICGKRVLQPPNGGAHPIRPAPVGPGGRPQQPDVDTPLPPGAFPEVGRRVVPRHYRNAVLRVRRSGHGQPRHRTIPHHTLLRLRRRPALAVGASRRGQRHRPGTRGLRLRRSFGSAAWAPCAEPASPYSAPPSSPLQSFSPWRHPCPAPGGAVSFRRGSGGWSPFLPQWGCFAAPA